MALVPAAKLSVLMYARRSDTAVPEKSDGSSRSTLFNVAISGELLIAHVGSLTSMLGW